MDQLRFITCGSVDDGKSTLIGRLLYDAGAVLKDQLEALESNRIKNENGSVNLALLTDGLKAEREQGITIDVAWKYFSTKQRRFVIIDAPGHVQYTRNMVTGASHADLAVLLIDARKGVLEQTRRHAGVTALLGLSTVVACVNKMDLVGWDPKVFENISKELAEVAKALGLGNIPVLPVSALDGDNITRPSAHTPWYKGPTLLDILEKAPAASVRVGMGGRFPVQYVIRPQSKDYHDYRGYAGSVLSGSFRVGDPVTVWPSGIEAKIKSIDLGGKELPQAVAPASATLQLDREIDVSRGDLIAAKGHEPVVSDTVAVRLFWLDEKPLREGARLVVRHGTAFLRASVREIPERLDILTLKPVTDESGARTLGMNDMGRAVIRLARPVAFDTYETNRLTGAMALIDESTHRTVGAALITGAVEEDQGAL